MRREPDARSIEACFDALFLANERTTLRGGAEEPVYVPARAERPARILYREDFLASALHEVAHWCVAGAARRQLPDYGYWYAAAGRDARAQRAFEAVEVRPQAIEAMFARALGVPFRVSLDNPGRSDCDPERFVGAVNAEIERLQQHGLPPRARRFHAALQMLSTRPEDQPIPDFLTCTACTVCGIDPVSTAATGEEGSRSPCCASGC